MKLYFKFLAMHFKRSLAYPASFFIDFVVRLLFTCNILLGIIFISLRFDTIGGYKLPEILLCYGVLLFGYTTMEVFMRGFDLFAYILRDAQFDRILVRPRGLIFQVLCHDIGAIQISRTLQSIAMIVYAVVYGDIVWTAGKVGVLMLMLLCSAALYFALDLLYASVCFFTLDGLEVMNIFIHGSQEFGRYPFNIYGKGILWLFTCVFPVALVQYWPLRYLMGSAPFWYGLLPLLSILFIIPCLMLWRFGVKHYRSTGS